MKGTLRYLFFAIEVNLVLWLCALGIVLSGEAEVGLLKTLIIVGAAVSAVVQHWAYYAVYKRAKEM
jgi:hypothetical protein